MARKARAFAAFALSIALLVPCALGILAGCGEKPNDGKDGSGNQIIDEEPEESVFGKGFASIMETEILDAYAVNGLTKEIAYLLSLDEDKLLADFRNNAKLDNKGASSYGGGWEGSLIGGHTLGHYLSALAQAYANAGASSAQKSQLKTRIDSIVSALEACQNNAVNAGAKEGFLWGARVLNASNPEAQFDNVEANRADIYSEAWVPWYTMHKILAGLIDVYNFTKNGTAKSVAQKLGDWVYDRVSKWSESKRATVLAIEYGGMNDALYNLYKLTQKEEHAVAAHKFDEDIANPGRGTSLFQDILSGPSDYLNNRHANTTIPKVIGALNRYFALHGKSIGGSTVDASEMITLAERFWTRVVEHHTYITGANSEWEHFGRDDILDAERTNANCETCNVYNMLKLSRMLFEVTKNKKYLDYYEGAYLNSIWSSQNPDTGMTTYFQPMATGYFKVYSSATAHFWCCTGSGMESFTKLNDSIYYLDSDKVYVSLYFASKLKTDDFELIQTADLENSDTVTLEVKEGKTKLLLRVPDWSETFSVKLNGNAVTDDISDGFFAVKVKKGDTVTVTLKKTVTAHSLPDNAHAYAFKYGPYVLSAELGTQNMNTTTTGVNVTVPAAKNLGSFSENIKILSGTRASFLSSIGEHLTRRADGKFVLSGTNHSLVYSYHFRQYTERYGLYFYFYGEDEELIEVPKSVEWDALDTVQPGYGQYEVDEWHAMQNDGSVGSTADAVMATSRYATAGGSFAYRMAVKKGAENHLVLYVAKADNGKSLLIKANGTQIYAATLNYTGGNSMYEMDIPIPDGVVNTAVSKTVNGETRDLLTFTFSGVGGAESARIGSYLYTKVFINHMAYFVDCGDFDPTTLSDGDYFGKYNSVTEQAFGTDKVTGKQWGIVDTYNKTWSGDNPRGVFTNSTWANEFSGTDGADKSVTNRYTKNQTESGLARKLGYKFELEDGTYTVVMYFTDPWSVSANPSVAANGVTKLTNAAVNKEVFFEVAVTGGFLTLDITSNSACINLAYIVILFGE